jgi:hypothetical protein
MPCRGAGWQNKPGAVLEKILGRQANFVCTIAAPMDQSCIEYSMVDGMPAEWC